MQFTMTFRKKLKVKSYVGWKKIVRPGHDELFHSGLNLMAPFNKGQQIPKTWTGNSKKSKCERALESESKRAW